MQDKQNITAAEQAAWHAGLDEGRVQAAGSVSNATSQAAPAAVAVPALSEEALKRLFDGMHAQHADKTALFSPFNWFTAGATMAEAALAATPAAAPSLISSLKSILADADVGPPTDSQRCCKECGQWTPWNHPEAHDHEDGCTAPREYAKRRDWKSRLSTLIAATPPAVAPVVLPEPVGWRHSRTLTLHETEQEVQLADGDSHAQPLFTEQQVRALLAGVSAPAAQQTRAWRGGKLTVADLVNNLLMMDQALPIYGAQYIEHPPGKRRAIAVPPTVSRERIKDSRWIGEGESLNAAVIWTRAEQPTPQVTLDYLWRARLLDGRPLVRDAMGFASHPELVLLDEGMKVKAFHAALGVEVRHTMAEDDLSMDEYDAMNDAGTWSNWTPKPPSGEAWHLVAIFDTEDGPAAWWMRELGINQ